ncbi:hypothetical protein [Tateyamaria sp.]|uniref:hypothetical protein n=1 Tax=Tateyamaria sp. TaxID=1929288 RepID=UPI00329CD131
MQHILSMGKERKKLKEVGGNTKAFDRVKQASIHWVAIFLTKGSGKSILPLSDEVCATAKTVGCAI